MREIGGPNVSARAYEARTRLRARINAMGARKNATPQPAPIGREGVGDTETVKHHAKNTGLYVLILASRHPKREEFWSKISTQEPSGQRRLALDG